MVLGKGLGNPVIVAQRGTGLFLPSLLSSKIVVLHTHAIRTMIAGIEAVTFYSECIQRQCVFAARVFFKSEVAIQ